MKKITMVLLFIMSMLLLIACQETIDTHGVKISGTKNWEVLQYSEKPDFLKGVTAYDNDNKDYTNMIEVLDEKLKMDIAGTYEIVYQMLLEGKKISLKSVEVHVIEVPDKEAKRINMFYVNDLHGAILKDENQLGLSQINSHIKSKQKKDALNVFIAGGDMLQGQMISNYFQGASVISALNEMKLDAFVMGNHEFDWGLEKVIQYFDGTHDVQANYPLLGANIYDKRTNQRPKGISPYTVVEKQGVKIGIIGVIGDGIESSIAKRMVENYEFRNGLSEVKIYTDILRNQEDVDLVVVVNHHEDDVFNEAVSKLDVDVIFNGHTHRSYIKTFNQKPVIQSGSSGSHLGYVEFFKNITWQISATQNLTSYDSEALNHEDKNLSAFIDEYAQIVDEASKEVLSKTNRSISKEALTNYVAKLMHTQTNVDIAFHNAGGTRAELAGNKNITLKDIYAVLPFDNVIVTLKLQGEYILKYMQNYGKNYHQSVYTFYSDVYYKVAVNDYSYGADSIFKHAIDVELTDIVLRDLMVDGIKNQTQQGHMYFDPNIDYVKRKRYQA